MEWLYGVVDPVILNGHYNRPGRDRGRLSSEYRQQPLYYQDHGLLAPAGPAGVGRVHRSASVSDPRRPAQIVINNEFDAHSPQPSPHRHHRHSSHGHDYHYDDYSDDSFDEPAHSPGRHRRHSRQRSRRRRSPSRDPSPAHDPEYERRMKKLEELERKEKEEEARQRFEEEMILKEAKKAKKKKEEDELKKKAIEEYNIKMLEEKAKKDKEKKEADEDYQKRVKKDLAKFGYEEEDIAKILKGEKDKEHGGHGKQKKIMDLSRPTYIKVHRKHLSPDTLDEYELPWEWDEVSPPIPFLLTLPYLASQAPIQEKEKLTHTPHSATPTTSSLSAGSPNTTRPSCSNTRASIASGSS